MFRAFLGNGVGTSCRLFTSLEHALFTAPNAFVRVQAFQNKFRCRYLGFNPVFRLYLQRSQFVAETLDGLQRLIDLRGRSGGAQPDFSAQIEPLHNLLHVGTVEKRIEGAGNGRANQLTSNIFRSPNLALIFQLEFAGNGRHAGVNVSHSWNDILLRVSRCALLSVGNHVLQTTDGQALAHAGALVNFFVLAGDDGDSLNHFADELR